MTKTKQPQVDIHPPETVAVADLKRHPKNYRSHPEDQLVHLEQSLREHGMYRNVVVARDLTILAGHGVVEAATRMGLEEMLVIRLDLDPDDPKALKVLAGDNELPRFAENDDRALADLLMLINEVDVDGLLGTGYDEHMLANLLFVTRSESEVPNLDAAAQWVGLPGFEGAEKRITLTIHFDTPEDREKLMAQLELATSAKNREAWATWWPPRPDNDRTSLRFNDTETETETDG